MCTGAESILGATLLGGQVAGTVATVANTVETSRKARHAAADAQRERLEAESQSAQRASAKMQMQRAALRKSSLYTGAGEAGGQSLGVG